MGFTEIIQVINDFGLVPVMFALIVFLILYILKKNRNDSKEKEEKAEKDKKEKSEQEEKIALILQGVMDSRVEVHTREEEDKNRKVNNYIEAQLSELISKQHANRAYVFMYHNGGKDVAGRNFQKMSITNEIVDVNTVPIMGSYQNIPRSMFPTVFKTLSEKDVYYIPNIDDIKETDAVFYQMLLTHGVKSAFIHGIKRDVDKMVLGFVVLEYVSSKCEDMDEAKEDLELKTMKISGALIGKGLEG